MAGDHPIVFLDNAEPLSYLVLGLPQASTAIGVIAWEDLPAMGDTPFLRRIKDLLADPHNGLLAVAAGPLSDAFKRSIARYGLSPNGDCITTAGRPFPLTWCPLIRTAPQG